MADPACATMDQHLLAGSDIGAIHQPLPGGNEHQWQRRRFAHAQCPGLGRDQSGIHDDVLGQGALDATDTPGHAEYFISRGETVYAVSQLGHRTGQVHAQYCRQRLPGMTRLPRGDLRIQRIDGRSLYLDQHFPCAWNGPGDVVHYKLGVGGFGNGSEHRVIHGGKPPVSGWAHLPRAGVFR